MIPKIAHFYWTGGPLPWLREQAIVSFCRLHPDWEVVLASPETRSVPPGCRYVFDRVTDSRLAPAARSDVYRYHALAEYGGLYADTDVIFMRNVEPLFNCDKRDAWITTDSGTALPCMGRYHSGRWKVQLSIGVLAAPKGSQFYKRVFNSARNVAPCEDYQSHGTSLIVKQWDHLSHGLLFGEIPGKAFYRGSSAKQVHPLWHTDEGGFGEHEYGLHWYGGSVESTPFLAARSVEDLPQGLVRRALTHSRDVVGSQRLDCLSEGRVSLESRGLAKLD